MTKRTLLLALAMVAALTVPGTGAQAVDRQEDDHSDNVSLLARQPIEIDKNIFAQGSDLAFQGKTIIAGSYEGLGVFKIVGKRAGYVKQVSFLPCPGGQGDVSVYGDLVFFSVDSPRKGPGCAAEESAAATPADTLAGTDWEGIRIFSIADPARPQEVATVRTDCGSHTNTLLPSGGKIYLYIESYPISGQGPTCNAQSHRKTSIVEVDPANPKKAEVVGTLDVSPAIGCHDVTVVPERDLAFGACVSEAQVWNIEDPAKPEIVGRIHNPAINIFHSTAMTWDGKYLALGDEYGGATADGCAGEADSTVGAMWFYDVSDPTAPVEMGHIALPRRPAGADDANEAQRVRCTTHNFNILPMRDEKKYIAVSSYYMGGMNVIDFSDPAAPVEIGHYLPLEVGTAPDMWSAYWYNGRVYTNDHGSKLGITAFKVKGTGHKKVWFFDGPANPQTQINSFR